MNHLRVQLTLAFLAVTVVAVALVALFAGWHASGEFQRYVWQQRGWQQGEFSPSADELSEDMAGEMGGQGRRGAGMGMGMGMGGHMPPPLQPADQAFLNHLRETLALSALAAGSIGTLAGLFISRGLAAPLGDLASAARDFAARRWERRVLERGVEEVVEVARAFNGMADELQRAETLRQNLMNDIAHELRTPLTVMQGSLRALLDGMYPLDLKEIASLYDETRLLGRLVGDLRDLALADAGQLPLALQAVSVKPLLANLVERFTPAADAESTRLELDAADDLPPVSADPDRLTQILTNLVINALRHTPGGAVTISARSQPGGVRFEVRDTGAGIAPDDLPRVFERFYRADESRSRETGSVGLGLAIAKAWVEAMGGTIGVGSTLGAGSAFWFTLPHGQLLAVSAR